MDFMVRASSSSTRATGMPYWMMPMTVSTAPSMVSKVQTAAEIASGMG